MTTGTLDHLTQRLLDWYETQRRSLRHEQHFFSSPWAASQWHAAHPDGIASWSQAAQRNEEAA